MYWPAKILCASCARLAWVKGYPSLSGSMKCRAHCSSWTLQKITAAVVTLSHQLLEAYYGKRKHSIFNLQLSCEFTSTSDTLKEMLELMKVNCSLLFELLWFWCLLLHSYDPLSKNLNTVVISKTILQFFFFFSFL